MEPLPGSRSVGQRRGRRLPHLSVAVLVGVLWRATTSFALPGSAAPQVGTAAGLASHRQPAHARTLGARGAAHPGASRTAAASGEEAAEAVQKPIKVTALGNARGCFVLEMGGQKLLINPNLEGLDIKPEKVHEMFDYVIVTSDKDEFCHAPSLLKMNLAKVNFVASGKAGEKLGQMLVKNLAVLAPGPGGRALLEGEEGTTPLAVMVTPGANGALPWDTPESGFIFVDLNTGVALAYEAMGQFLGPGARSTRDGIPEEAYQVDYLVTPDLREAAATLEGLTEKGAQLRGVVALPSPQAAPAAEDAGLLSPLIALDRKVDEVLGGVGDTPDEFRDFLRKKGGPMKDTRLLLPAVGGDAVQLE